MQTWGLTDPGMIREQNQDSFLILPFGKERALMVVCDGMGGAKSGNVASALAVEVFSDEIRRSQRADLTERAVRYMLRDALDLANQAVYEQAQISETFRGMGTTLVAAYLTKEAAYILNVGDSRAYHFSAEGGVRQVTCDHSIVEMMVQRGELTAEQAKNHPGKNIITRAVGTEATVESDFYVQTMKKDECLLLCSDGLSNEMADQEMLFEVAHGIRKSDCCQRLLNIAKNRGAPDNVTVTLAAY